MEIGSTEFYWALVSAVVLGGSLAFLFWKQRQSVKQMSGNQASRDAGNPSVVQLQLNAYERLILLTERIALPNLVSRMNEPGRTAREMQFLLTSAIKQEFEHNVTQQLYVTSEAWDALRNLKDQNIHIINQVAGFLPEGASGTDLNKTLLEMIVQNPKASLHDVVSEVLSYEAKALLKK